METKSQICFHPKTPLNHGTPLIKTSHNTMHIWYNIQIFLMCPCPCIWLLLHVFDAYLTSISNSWLGSLGGWLGRGDLLLPCQHYQHHCLQMFAILHSTSHIGSSIHPCLCTGGAGGKFCAGLAVAFAAGFAAAFAPANDSDLFPRQLATKIGQLLWRYSDSSNIPS